MRFKAYASSLFICLPLVLTFSAKSQASKKSFVFNRQGVVDMSAAVPDYQPALLVREMPEQGQEEVEQYVYPEKDNSSSRKPSAPLPGLIKGMSFIGNQFAVSTPCDNDMAISDTGFVVSVMNTNIFFKKTNPSQNFPGKSLSVFTSPINSNHSEFDPKVIYDPDADRFILMCLVGFLDSTSKAIVGFSQTNDPTGNWNLYSLPGNPLNDSLWSDYPMIALTKKDLYLSLNLLRNNTTWQAGFVQTIVWQIKKSNGYNGTPLVSDLHYNIKHNGRAIRNLCPAKGGSQLYGPNMYFVSNRNLASQNDTVFLVNITDTTGAPGNTVTAMPLVSNQMYIFPTDGVQPLAGQTLATNDSRNLGAFFENNKIQYVHNTKHPLTNLTTIYHGVISSPQTASPTVSGYILDNDTMCFGYPNISYSGKSSNDDMATITFDHSSTKVYPGVSAIQTDGAGNYSPILRIQNGYSSVNLLTGNQERWGDYSGSQRRYNRQGEVWMSGYLGYSYSAQYPYSHAAWIAQLTNSLTPVDTTGVLELSDNKPSDANVYPNPATDLFTVNFQLLKPEYLNFELYDAQGRKVASLMRDMIRLNDVTFTFSTRDLPKGVYLLKIIGAENTNFSKKVIVN